MTFVKFTVHGSAYEQEKIYRVEDFRTATVTRELVNVRFSDDAWHAVLPDEWARIQPLLMGQSSALPQGVLNLIASMNAAVSSAFTAGDRRDSEGLDYYEDMANAYGRELLKALNAHLENLKEGQS